MLEPWATVNDGGCLFLVYRCDGELRRMRITPAQNMRWKRVCRRVRDERRAEYIRAIGGPWRVTF